MPMIQTITKEVEVPQVVFEEEVVQVPIQKQAWSAPVIAHLELLFWGSHTVQVHVPVVQKVQKTVEVPQVQYEDQVVQVPIQTQARLCIAA